MNRSIKSGITDFAIGLALTLAAVLHRPHDRSYAQIPSEGSGSKYHLCGKWFQSGIDRGAWAY